MVRSNDEPIVTLNNLIAICFDAYEGFRLAAQGADEPRLRTLLLGYAAQRALFAEELQTHVRKLGGEAAGGGSVAGTLHPGWLDVRMALAGKEDPAIIGECERGERALLAEYHDAEQVDLPPHVKQLVRRQAEFVQTTRDRMHVMMQTQHAHYEWAPPAGTSWNQG